MVRCYEVDAHAVCELYEIACGTYPILLVDLPV
jgi:hypothetical protein